MHHPRILILLFVAAISSSALAADPAAPKHWYRITIAAGNSTVSFIGTSSLDADNLAYKLTQTDPIMLENRRERFADPRHNLEMRWHPNDEALKVFIVPRAVLFFEELSGDPAAGTK